MGQYHSQPTYAPPRRERDYNGPLFGGHYRGDFSLKITQPMFGVNKPLPALPQGKSFRFGHAPPAWEFHRNAPTWDNTANTRYCSPAYTPVSNHQTGFDQPQSRRWTTPPPAYPYGARRGDMYVVNR